MSAIIEYDEIFKIIQFGNLGVSKSNLLLRFADYIFLIIIYHKQVWISNIKEILYWLYDKNIQMIQQSSQNKLIGNKNDLGEKREIINNKESDQQIYQTFILLKPQPIMENNIEQAFKQYHIKFSSKNYIIKNLILKKNLNNNKRICEYLIFLNKYLNAKVHIFTYLQAFDLLHNFHLQFKQIFL
ncbi:unnamed protein product [Paramecium sonneborni]|uniref:Uncharacterized protein n=1 Tax=Paramecium sonneborni TaxID=65129 RepID=A0A8S1NEP2_9CILI|nr:unnamed protein product [Paramecium sonneborni]